MAGSALADTPAGLNIPASACIPNKASWDLLDLSSGSWIFASAETGTATLWCPVSLANWQWDNGTYQTINLIHLWYRDSDGGLAPTSVSAQLFLREPNDLGITAVSGASISSNGSGVTGNNQVYVDIDSYLMVGALYFVKVTMVRASTAQSANFHGLSLTTFTGY